MRILLTGADGFTGRHFTAHAEAAGHEIVPLRADLREADAVAQEVASSTADAAVHLAAIAFVGHADERAFYDVNLFGTLNLLRGLKLAGRPWRKVLLASSANVYGNCEQSPIPESQAPAPVNHYAMSKLAVEHMARARHPELPLVITRPFNYTGPGQTLDFVIPKLVDHFRRRASRISLGNLHVRREYNDVRFVCDAYLRLLDASPGTWNVCTGRTHSFDELLATLERLTGHHIEVQVDPALVRPNEVHTLCGDPARLRQAIGELPACSLDDTLQWMLTAAQ